MAGLAGGRPNPIAWNVEVLSFIMQRPELAPLREWLGSGPDSQVLLLNTEGNTDPDDSRKVVWEGAPAVPQGFMATQLES